MSHDRRAFLGRLAALAGTGAVAGALPLSLDARRALAEPAPQPGQKWDVSWTNRLKGRYRAVFDVAQIDSGYGVWRASVWEMQYAQVLGVSPADMSAVIVLRADGLPLAMQQAYWDKHLLGKAYGVKH